MKHTLPSSILTENGLTVEQEKEIEQASQEAKQGINVSGPFKTAKEMFAHLNTPK